jgi:hypothetical protein
MDRTSSIRSLLWARGNKEGLVLEGTSPLYLGLAALAAAAVGLLLKASAIEPGASQKGAASLEAQAAQGIQMDKPSTLSLAKTGKSLAVSPGDEYSTPGDGMFYLDVAYARSPAQTGMR